MVLKCRYIFISRMYGGKCICMVYESWPCKIVTWNVISVEHGDFSVAEISFTIVFLNKRQTQFPDKDIIKKGDIILSLAMKI